MALAHYSDSALSLLPPLLAVVLAITTRRVLLSLGIGILAGALLLNLGAPGATAHYLAEKFTNIVWSEGSWNSWNLNIIGFLLLLGCLISLMAISGGTRAFALWAQRRIQTRRQAKMMTGLLVFLFFIDDYFHSLAVGTICRPVTDRHRISRAKLAYLLDSTAAPVCVLMPVSSWGAYIIAIIGGILAAHGLTGHSPLATFMAMAPMNLYAVFTLLMVALVVLRDLDLGSMARHEAAAAQGELFDPARGIPPGASAELPESERGQVKDLAWPIITLVLATVFFMIYSGASKLAVEGAAFSLLKALENTDVGLSLVKGGASALLVAGALALRLRLPLTHWGLAVRQGLLAMWPAIRILVLAWAVGAVIRDMETGKFLASLTQSGLSVGLLPAMLFVLAGIMAFSTGTSWGTFGIMLPLAGDLAMASEPGLLLPMLSAVLAGSVFGDHCSPISDTTILSSTGAGCHHMDHVVTQLPYALLIALATVLGYLALGFSGSTLLGLTVTGLVLLPCLLWWRRRAVLQPA
ncbi:MAG: Na+/H+ antiporter NhaC family protein [Aeromonadaceae bacterium]|nr:Na+/H+ antiporter NhaC family protein [Aeromonadaceae bacterium]